MNVQQTSMEAFESMIPLLNERQSVVYDVIRDHPGMSNHDIARFLHWEINCVTPRVNELRELGVVVFHGTKVDRVTGRNVMCWRVYE